MTSENQTRVLFVCLGNICRSPAAEAVFQKLVDDRGLSESFVVDSAGTSGYHDGEPADPRMIKHGAKRGFDLKSISRKLIASDFQKFDYIITMDHQNLENAQKLAVNESDSAKLNEMVSFLQTLKSDVIPDPYFGGEDGFEHVFDLLEDACAGLLSNLTN